MSGEAPEVVRVHRAMADTFRAHQVEPPPTAAQVEAEYVADVADSKRSAWAMFARVGLWGALFGALAIAASTLVAGACWAAYQLVADLRWSKERRARRLALLEVLPVKAGAGAPPALPLDVMPSEVSPVRAGGELVEPSRSSEPSRPGPVDSVARLVAR